MTATKVSPKDLDVDAARALCTALPRFLDSGSLESGIKGCVAIGGSAETIRAALEGGEGYPRVAYTNVLFWILFVLGIHENTFYEWFLESEADRLTSAQQDVVRGLYQT